MRCVFRSDSKFLAMFSCVGARRSSVRTETPGRIPLFKCEAFLGRNQNSWRRFPVSMRGVFRSGPKLLAIFPDVHARGLSVRTTIPGNHYQFECEALLGQNRNSWRYLAVCARDVFRSEPKFLAIFTNVAAMCYSVRTETPDGISQFK